MLKDIKDETDSDQVYFSGSGEISAIDIMLHSEICTIIDMYSSTQRISDKKYIELSAWMDMMNSDSYIETNLSHMKDVIRTHKLYGTQVEI